MVPLVDRTVRQEAFVTKAPNSRHKRDEPALSDNIRPEPYEQPKVKRHDPPGVIRQGDYPNNDYDDLIAYSWAPENYAPVTNHRYWTDNDYIYYDQRDVSTWVYQIGERVNPRHRVSLTHSNMIRYDLFGPSSD